MNKTISEKKTFLEEIIPLAADPSKKDEMQQKHYAFLLQNTNGGKLYKYRTFDSHGYALNSLINGTLHCSRPDTFNDPFDSKMGADFQSIIRAKWEKELSLIESAFDKFCRVTIGELNLSDCSTNEQRIIIALSNNEKVMRFVNDTERGFSTPEEASEYLRNHMSVLTELLKVVINDPALGDTLGVTRELLLRMAEMITSEDVYNYNDDRTSFQDFARINGVDADTDEIGLTMLLSNKLQPDNKAVLEKAEKLLDAMTRQMTEKLNALFLIGCLATDPKNRLMWSHYADSHRGFCIEYDFNSLKDEVLPFPIIYSESRPLIPWKAAIDHTSESNEQAIKDLTLGLLTKDQAWKYENEWRVLLPAANPPDLKVPITAIYLGAHISSENKAIILEIANNHKIPVKQMKTDRGAYELHAEDILNLSGE